MSLARGMSMLSDSARIIPHPRTAHKRLQQYTNR